MRSRTYDITLSRISMPTINWSGYRGDNLVDAQGSHRNQVSIMQHKAKTKRLAICVFRPNKTMRQ